MERDDRTRRIDPYLLVAAMYFTVGLLALAGRLGVEAGLVAGLPRPRWTTIHLVTVGGMTQVLFAALPRLVRLQGGALVGGRPWLRWLGLNAGYPLVLIGMTAGATLVTIAGALLVLAALLLLGVAATRSSTSDGTRAFRVAPWFLAVGILAALGMLTGVHGPGGYFGSIEAHVHANVWGFLGLTAAGALSVLVPRLTGEPLPRPGLRPWSVAGIAVGATGLTAGPWLAIPAVTFFGLAVYLAGTAVLLANVVGAWRASGGLDTRLGHVLGAYLWLLFPVPWAPFVLLTPELVPAGAIERAAIDGLVFGWMLQLAMAFLPVLVAWTGVEDVDVADAVDYVGTPSRVALVAVNLGVLALWVVAMPVAAGAEAFLTLGGLSLIGVSWAIFAFHLWGVTDRTAESAGIATPA